MFLSEQICDPFSGDPRADLYSKTSNYIIFIEFINTRSNTSPSELRESCTTACETMRKRKKRTRKWDRAEDGQITVVDFLTLLQLKKAVDHINRYLCVSENSSSCIPFSEIAQQSTRQVLSVKYDLFREIHVILSHWGYSYVALLGSRTFFKWGAKKLSRTQSTI